MAILSTSAGAGVDFDGTVGQGEFLLGGLVGNDPKRILIHSVGVSADSNILTVSVKLAPSLAAANGDLFLEILALAEAAPGVMKTGCSILVPPAWNVYFFSTDSGAATKNAILDFRRITYRLDGP